MTLAARIADGPLPLGDALTCASQIAQALQAAHEKGIIHRDFEAGQHQGDPAGVVKVLDFGLAKTAAPDPDITGVSESPTVVGATRVGVVLGTAAYMSPEQARGLPIDARTDTWAFGCVLFEMLSGRQTFAADATSDSIAKIFERDPDWSALPKGIPSNASRPGAALPAEKCQCPVVDYCSGADGASTSYCGRNRLRLVGSG